MIKKLIAFMILTAGMATAQTTPNLGLELPNYQAPNWGVAINYNFMKLDGFLSGGYTLPAFISQGLTLTNLTPGDCVEASSTGQLITVAGACSNFTLTTTGTSGPATLANGVLNIPQYNPIPTGTTNQLLYYAAGGTTLTPLTLGTNLSITGGTLNASGGSGTVTGSGTTGYLPAWTSSSALGDSHIDDGVTTSGYLTAHEPFVDAQAVSAATPSIIGENTYTSGNYVEPAHFYCPNITAGTTAGCGVNVGVAAPGPNDGLTSVFGFRYLGTTATNYGYLEMGTTGTFNPALLWYYNQTLSLPAYLSANLLVTDSNGLLSEGTYNNIVSLWTSCTSGYLKYDGTCSTPPSSGITQIVGPSSTVTGSVTFTGSGVSQTGNTFTFTGGSGSGTVTDGSGTTSPYFIPVSTSTAHAISYSNMQIVDCGGVNDTTALQTALTAGGVIFVTGNCVENSHLVIGSNTTLIATGATFTYTATAADNLLVNSDAYQSATPVRSFTDGSLSSNSKVLTSATASFTSADIGRSIDCTGAAGASYKLFTEIVSVNSSTSVNLQDAASSTVTGSTCAIYNRNSNITIIGGTYTLGGNLGNTVSYSALMFQSVNNLTLQNVTLSAPSGGFWQTTITDVNGFYVSNYNVTSASINEDGLHVQGPAVNGFILGVTCNTGDDCVAVDTEDTQTATYAGIPGTYGNVHGIQINGVSGQGTNLSVEAGVKLYVSNNGATLTMSDMQISNLTNTGNGFANSIVLLGLGSGSATILSNVQVNNIRGNSQLGNGILESSLSPSGLTYWNVTGAVPSGNPLTAAHFTAEGNPTLTPGSGAGTSPVPSLNGDDEEGQITMVTGTTPSASSTLATITLTSACPGSVLPVSLVPLNAATAALSGASQVYGKTLSGTQWSIDTNSTALAASTTYQWGYQAKCVAALTPLTQLAYVAESTTVQASITSPSVAVPAGSSVIVACRSGYITSGSIAASSSLSTTWNAVGTDVGTSSIASESVSEAYFSSGGSSTFTCTPPASVGYQSMVVMVSSSNLTLDSGSVVHSNSASGSSYTSPSFSTASAPEIGVLCVTPAGSQTFTAGAIAGTTSTIAGISGASGTNTDMACEVAVLYSTVSSQTAAMTWTPSAGGVTGVFGAFTY